jgi:hypothetical protein
MSAVLQHANLTYEVFAAEIHFIGSRGVPINLNNAPTRNYHIELASH